MFRTSGTFQPIYVLHRHTPRYLVGESGDQEWPSLILPGIMIPDGQTTFKIRTLKH
jgi:hypothetical protein